LIESFSTYLGIIASWLAIFTVLDQLCNTEAKIRVKNYFTKITYTHEDWSRDFLKIFKHFFKEGKIFIRIIFVSSFIFLFLSLLSYLFGKIDAIQLLEVTNSLVLTCSLLIVINYFSRKSPFCRFGVGYNNYKKFSITVILFPVLALVALVVQFPILMLIYLKINEQPELYNLLEYNHSIVIISIIFLGNFITDYIAIHLTKRFLEKCVKDKRKIIMVVLYDFLLKVAIYIAGVVLVGFIFSYYSGYDVGVIYRIRVLYKDLSSFYFIFAVISLYSTLVSTIWLLFFILVKYLLVLMNKYKDYYLGLAKYIRLENIFTIFSVITLPVFLLIIFIFEIII